MQRRVVFGGTTFVAGTMAAYSDDIEQLPFDLAGVAQWTFRRLDAEQAHNVGLWCAMHGLLPRERRPDPPSLRSTVWGRHFSSPIGEVATCVLHKPHKQQNMQQRYSVDEPLWRRQTGLVV